MSGIWPFKKVGELHCPMCNSRLIEEEDHTAHALTAFCYTRMYHCYDCGWKGNFHVPFIEIDRPVASSV